MRPHLLLVAGGILFATQIATTTTVIAPTFHELVAEAQLVLVGHVTNTQALWVSAGAHRQISTDVTFEVESVLKGESASTHVLRFVGGTLDGDTLRIPGVPEFQTGDRALLFVSATTHAISPLVGVMHGRFPIRQGTDGFDYVTLHDGRAFSRVEQVGPTAVVVSATPIRTMRLADFVREIRLELQQLRVRR